MKKKILLLLILVGLTFLSGRPETGGSVLAQGEWVSPTGHTGNGFEWGSDGLAYDEDTTSRSHANATALGWTPFLELTYLETEIQCNKVRFNVGSDQSDYVTLVDLDVYKDGAWVDVYEGAYDNNQWMEKTFSEGVVSKARLRLYNREFTRGSRWAYVYEFDFWDLTNKPPTVDRVRISADPIVADGETSYRINIKASDPDGVSDLNDIRTLINHQQEVGETGNAGIWRGYFRWDEDSFTSSSWSQKVTCSSGGGYGYKYTGATRNGYGKEYVDLSDCITSTSGNQRTVKFVFHANTNWGTDGPLTDNDISGWAEDDEGLRDGWDNFDLNFSVAAPTPTPTPTPTPAPSVKTMCAYSSGSGGGTVSAQTITRPTETSAISERGFVVTGYSDVDFHSYEDLQDVYDFDNATEINQLSQISSPGRYKIITDEYSINPPTAPCKQLGVSAVIFIDGSLRIRKEFSDVLTNPSIEDLLAARQNCKTATGNTTSPVFIVKDNIVVESGVNNIYGIFYAGGDFVTEAAATPPDGRLFIFGSLLANGFSLGRTLEADNDNYPAEQIIFMPKYFLDLGSENLLGQAKITWREK